MDRDKLKKLYNSDDKKQMEQTQSLIKMISSTEFNDLSRTSYEDSYQKRAIDEFIEYSKLQEQKNQRHAKIALWCSIISTVAAVITLLPLINKTIQYLISILS